MDYTFVAYTFGMVLKISAIVVGVCVCASVFASIVRVSTQVDDNVINYALKSMAVLALLYFVGGEFFEQLLSYAKSVWSAAGSYV